MHSAFGLQKYLKILGNKRFCFIFKVNSATRSYKYFFRINLLDGSAGNCRKVLIPAYFSVFELFSLDFLVVSMIFKFFSYFKVVTVIEGLLWRSPKGNRMDLLFGTSFRRRWHYYNLPQNCENGIRLFTELIYNRHTAFI